MSEIEETGEAWLLLSLRVAILILDPLFEPFDFLLADDLSLLARLIMGGDEADDVDNVEADGDDDEPTTGPPFF